MLSLRRCRRDDLVVVTMEPPHLSPKAFLKARRPERFSDSRIKQSDDVDRSQLEYHIATITSRSQEKDFEHFARRLAEREICPNLRPQTGPTGGGDSKVDSETYPVAEQLTLTWYSGVGSEASRERWAFAFSAKEDWSAKLRSDIKKIVSTGRGYKKAFFVTSQAVPDRRRAAAEDRLSTQHGLDVRILDRTWILDRVFSNHHEAIAIDELHVSAIRRSDVLRGPRDTQREEDLADTEKRIADAVQKGQYSLALVAQTLEAANLARQIERPRADVEGRFARADRLAMEYGTSQQQVESAYEWAWTLYWWFEDTDAFAGQYRLVEERVKGSRNAHDLEQLSALWKLIWVAGKREQVDSEQVALHRETLFAELRRLTTEVDRPSTALHAETLLLEIQLLLRIEAGEPPDEVLRSLCSVVQRSEGLIGYPLQPIVKIFTEIGPVLEPYEGYDELFETLVEASSRRDGEVSAAQLLLRRGEGQLRQCKPMEAIATLGRALRRLYKHEARHEMVRALYLCGCAYDAVGLPWAARGTLTTAASIAASEWWRYGDVTPLQGACYRRLKWLELRLGRLQHLLAWHQLEIAVRQVLAESGLDAESPDEREKAFRLLVARLLLRTAFSDLNSLQSLPDALDQVGLHLAADALLYALGHEERLSEGARTIDESVEVLAHRWMNLRADFPLATSPLLYDGDTVLLSSRILGCHVFVKSRTEPSCLEVSESFLAVLESLLATGPLHDAVSFEPELPVEVTVTDAPASLVESQITERGGRPHLTVRCQPFRTHDLDLTGRAELKESVFNTAVAALASIVVFRDPEQDVRLLFRDEHAADRSGSFSAAVGAQEEVLGNYPTTLLSSLNDDRVARYPLRRKEPWTAFDAEAEEPPLDPSQELRLAPDAEPPLELLDPNQRTHDQMSTVSLIREGLWRRAEWSGVFFMTSPDHAFTPVLALIFKNLEAGRQIFVHWREEVGEIDVHERIRVVVVKGIDRTQPHAYRVIVGPESTHYPFSTRFVTILSRIRRMDPTSSVNLDRFLDAHAASGAFFLAPAFVAPGESQTPDADMNLRIGVHHVHVRHAWEIGVNDLDCVAIQDDDDPMIPEGVTEAPVDKLLERRRTSERSNTFVRQPV